MGTGEGGLVGRTVGGWRVLRPLGSGAMGAVFEARGPAEARGALKVLVVEARGDEELRQAARRLRDEAAAASRVACPHLARVLDLGDDEFAGPFVVYELLPGETLRARLSRVARLPWRAAMDEVLEPLLLALEALHGAGVVHRDVKPENLIAGADGRFRLADLGLAVFEGREARTRTGTAMGTPGYLAPERLLQPDLRPGPEADVYGAAVVAVEALTGRLPFRGHSPVEVLKDQVAHDPSAGDLAKLGLAPAAAQVLARALARAPARRTARARLLLEELRAAPGSAVVEPGRRRSLPIMSLALGLSFAVALGLMAWRLSAPPSPPTRGGSAAPSARARNPESLLDRCRTLADQGLRPEPAALRRLADALDEFVEDESQDAARRSARDALARDVAGLPAGPATGLASAVLAARDGRLTEADAALGGSVSAFRGWLTTAPAGAQRAGLDVERLLAAAQLRVRARGPWTERGAWYEPFVESERFLTERASVQALVSPEGAAHRFLARVALAEASALRGSVDEVADLAPGLDVLVDCPGLPAWAAAEGRAGLRRAAAALGRRAATDGDRPLARWRSSGAQVPATALPPFADRLAGLLADAARQVDGARKDWSAAEPRVLRIAAAGSFDRTEGERVARSCVARRRRAFWAYDAATAVSPCGLLQRKDLCAAATDVVRLSYGGDPRYALLLPAFWGDVLGSRVAALRALSELVVVARAVGARTAGFESDDARWSGEAFLADEGGDWLGRLRDAGARELLLEFEAALEPALRGAPVAHAYLVSERAFALSAGEAGRASFLVAFALVLEELERQAPAPEPLFDQRWSLFDDVARHGWRRLRGLGDAAVPLAGARVVRALVERRCGDVARAGRPFRTLWSAAVLIEAGLLPDDATASERAALRRLLDRIGRDREVDGSWREAAHGLLEGRTLPEGVP